MNLLRLFLFFCAACISYSGLYAMALPSLPTADPSSDFDSGTTPEQPAPTSDMAPLAVPTQPVASIVTPVITSPFQVTPTASLSPVVAATPATPEAAPTPLQGPDVLQIKESEENKLQPTRQLSATNVAAMEKAISEMDAAFDEMRKKSRELSQALSSKNLEIDSFLQRTAQIVGELEQRVNNTKNPLKQLETQPTPVVQPIPTSPLPIPLTIPTV